MTAMDTTRPEPARAPRGGWLRPLDGVVGFVETPPRSVGSDIVLAAARFAADRTIAADVYRWVSELSCDDMAWSDTTTSLLCDLLRRGTDASWAFLHETAFLERQFPDFVNVLEPEHDFSAVEALRDTTAVANAQSDTLLLAAFFGSIFSDPRHLDDALNSIGLRVDIVDEIVDLVSGARVLLASVTRQHLVIDGRFLNHIAHGLRRPGIVERSRLLPDALGNPDPRQHAAMIEITTGVQLVLAHPELLDDSADSLEGLMRREAIALCAHEQTTARIVDAPTAYVLAHEPSHLVERLRLLEPAPRDTDVRVTVDDGPVAHSHTVSVVCVDRPGLLSRLTAVLAAERLSVVSASLATWPDGSVLDSFVVTGAASEAPPDPTRLEALFVAAFETDPPVPHLPGRQLAAPDVVLDNSLHPLHSVLKVTGRDQLGLLSVVTRAISAAGVVIHHAVVRTAAGSVDDDFEVSRPDGTKIDAADLDTILRHLTA